ncbi:hypothetical protein Rfer_4422 (plasmid) [Rhodoferax ferrireducens T118]|uniref:Uncharacterized protein n=1 Tax=Albidiferax ferrireducens (strain ATCC BAA-621 / DSM 15236 / T118) TaxID=338969 RepID=Q21Q37_ALBFT|nr:hypothetical protein [Rhodoferax ferrireducens]ABD72108.1 hypothetical protein Rfer_4422 [Rhodoferax ferrireducens T118]
MSSDNQVYCNIGAFKPSTTPWLTALRAGVVGLVLRIALRFNFVVVLIGVARSGKTYLLERTTPGKIIDESRYWRTSAKPPVFDVSTVPNGLFAIDESACFERGSLSEGIKRLASRAFIICVQRRNDLDNMGIREALNGRRILVLEIK